MTEQAAIGHQSGGTVPSFDRVLAFRLVKTSQMLPTQAGNVPVRANYGAKVNARTPSEQLFRMGDSHVKVVHSRKGLLLSVAGEFGG